MTSEQNLYTICKLPNNCQMILMKFSNKLFNEIVYKKLLIKIKLYKKMKILIKISSTSVL